MPLWRVALVAEISFQQQQQQYVTKECMVDVTLIQLPPCRLLIDCKRLLSLSLPPSPFPREPSLELPINLARRRRKLDVELGDVAVCNGDINNQMPLRTRGHVDQ